MAENTIPVAVAGLGAYGLQMTEALTLCSGVTLAAVSDKNPATAQSASKRFNVPCYSDNRQFISEAKPAIVFLCIPPMACPELIKHCAQRGIHVWKDAPLARNIEEAVGFIEMMDKASLKFAVGTQRRFTKTYRQAWQMRNEIGEIFLARGNYMFNWGPNLGWRGDRESAGGGALLELGYHPIDLLVWMMGFPEDVFAVTAQGHRPPLRDDSPQPVYDTEDTSISVIRYTAQSMANIVTTRCSGPVSEQFILHGKKGSLNINSDRCVLTDPDGNIIDQVENNLSAQDALVLQAQAFIDAVRENKKLYECSALENLLNLAVIEAMYLSSRTGQPEHPARFLKNHGYDPSDCLTLNPQEQNNI